MDFSLSETQEMLADSIEKFIENDYAFEARQQHAASDIGYSADVWRTFAELGWTAIPFSENDGGFGGTAVDVMVVMQRLGRGLVVEPYLANVILAGGILKRNASDEQKATFLTPMIEGTSQMSLAFAEPQGRYHLNDIATTAKQRDGGWVLNGHKAFVLNGGNANAIIIPARTSGAQRDTLGITLFVVDAHNSGVARNAYPTIDGQQAAEIRLENVQVSDSGVLGEVDAGYDSLDATIDDATLAICAEAVGILHVLKDKTVEYSKNRIQFGVPIGTFQALQHRMVDMLTDCEQSQSLLMWAAMLSESGSEDAKRAISSIKYQIGTAGRKVGEEAVQLHGGMGVTWELDIAHYFKRLIAIGQMFGNADWHLDQLAV